MARPNEYMRTEQLRHEFETRARAGMKRHIELHETDLKTIAARQGVSVQTVRNWLDKPGSMSLEKAWNLAMFLNCPISEIVGGETPEEMTVKMLAKAMKTG